MRFFNSPAAHIVCAGLFLLYSSHSLAAKPKSAHKVQRTTPDHVGEYANFMQWQEVNDFIRKMVDKHQFDQAELTRIMGQAHFIEAAVQLIKPAPSGKPKNWALYRALFVEPKRIAAGVQFWRTHGDTLARAEQTYGVPAEIIVGVIGVETVYGRNTGNFRVLDVITTLAFAYPQTPKREERMAFFRSELENALLLAREMGVDPFSLRGSYAGAIGWPQFMPSSIRKYAVDFDVDGVTDLRNSPADAIGSVANYLRTFGWQAGQPSVFPAQILPGGNIDAMLNQGLEAKYRLSEMQENGVSFAPNLPSELQYGLIDLQNGNAKTEYFLGTNNFFSITKYNRSYFYAMSVLELGKSVRDALQK